MQQLLPIEYEWIVWRNRHYFHDPSVALVKGAGALVCGQTAQSGGAGQVGAGAFQQQGAHAVVLPVRIDEKVLDEASGMIDGGKAYDQAAYFRHPDLLVLDRAPVIFKVERGGGLPVEGGAAGCEKDFGATQVIVSPGEPDHDRGFPTLKHVLAPCATPLSLCQQGRWCFIQEGLSVECASPLMKGLAHTVVWNKQSLVG
jgi:hypothetical protein